MARKKSKSTRVKGSSISGKAANRGTMTSKEFNPDYSYVIQDLKRIVIMAGSFVVVLIVLSFVLN